MRIAGHIEHQYFERTLQRELKFLLRLSECRDNVKLFGRRLFCRPAWEFRRA